MEILFPLIIAWIILAIPVFFFAYAIFLVRENKTVKYSAVYGRAALMVCLSAAIIGGYIFIPYFMGKASITPEYAVEGVYYDQMNGDTITFRNGAMTIKGKLPYNSATGNFSVVQTDNDFERQFAAGMGSMIRAQGAGDSRNRTLTMSWIDSTAYKKAFANGKTPTKKQLNDYSIRPQYRSASWWIETKTEKELILLPGFNNFSAKRFLTKL